MKTIKIDAHYLKSITSEKASGLTAHFDRLAKGTAPTPRTPLYRNRSESAVLDGLLSLLSEAKDKFPRLVEYEFTRVSKFGPQGGVPPLSERMHKLELYYSRFTAAEIRKAPEYQDLVAKTRKRLFGDKHSLRALEPEQVLKLDIAQDKLETNSGLPDFGKRSRPDILSKALGDAKDGSWKRYPAVLGSRSSRLKDRFIFMFPMSTNIVEKRYVIPIMNTIRENRVLSFAAWEGFDDVELAFAEQEAFTAAICASMDYEGMDQTVGPDQKMIVYDIVAPVFQAQYREGLKESMLHSNSIPIMISKDTILTGEHGEASGSGWTNLGESILSEFNLTMINEIVPLIGRQLLGDDGAMTTNFPIELEEFGNVIQECSKQVGLVANADKQKIDLNTLVYLQRFFDKSILIENSDIVAGAYPAVLALNSAMNPENFHDPRKWDGKMETLRWIMILENCKHHPLFHRIVDYFMKGDKFELGIKIPGFLKRGIFETFKKAKTIRGYVPTYTTTHQNRGIQDFEVYKYLVQVAGLG